MSSEDVAISVSGLCKDYRIVHKAAKATTLGEALMRRARNPLFRPQVETFHALRDVTFDVKRGDVVGIIGRNGAGKSTLLKILSRITAPSAGEVHLHGRVGSLLEVGTGFHPELTGRENVFLNGAILGMRRSEIKRHFDAIADFSGVEKFLDTPVKRYSSGMYVRLAFAVAAHLNPEILIVDEVLAVGDAEFQKKCLGKMQEVSEGQGRTVLFVSHNMAAIQSLCRSVVVMEEGQNSSVLSPEDGIARYFKTDDETIALSQKPRKQAAKRPPIFHKLTIIGGGASGVVAAGESIEFAVEMRDFTDVSNGICGIIITDNRGHRVVAFQTEYNQNLVFRGASQATLRCRVPSLPLVPGTYSVDLVLVDRYQLLERVEQAARFDVVFADVFGTGKLPSAGQGYLALHCNWEYAPHDRTATPVLA